MMWQETPDESSLVIPRDVIDLSFRINCRELPVDHAWLLSEAVCRVANWIDEEPVAAIHSIHGAASGNGWVRPPEAPGSLLQLSRRTRLYLRVPESREADARALCHHTLELDGFRIAVGECQTRPLTPTDTVFARSIVDEHADDDDETVFTQRIAEALLERNITPRKILCGLRHVIHSPHGDLVARSVLISDLEPLQAIRLQERGIGPGRRLGCGIFLPHKSLAAVGSRQERH